jgi:hypothetical protein
VFAKGTSEEEAAAIEGSACQDEPPYAANWSSYGTELVVQGNVVVSMTLDGSLDSSDEGGSS